MQRCELRYQPLHGGCSYVFPCDEKGQVLLDELGERQLRNYLFVSVLVGRDFGVPVVCVRDDDPPP